MAQRLSVGGRTLGIVLGALTALALYSQAAGAEGKRDEGRARRDPSGESAPEPPEEDAERAAVQRESDLDPGLQAILEEVGFDPGKQMTVNLKGISLESALDLILRQEGLVWTICDEIFLITTPEERDNLPMTTELYPVGDLVERRDEEGGSHDDYKTLVKLIVSHVARTSWAEAGGPGTITGATFGSAKVLVVTHDYRVHRQIEGLLERIRAEGRQPASEGKPATRRRP